MLGHQGVNRGQIPWRSQVRDRRMGRAEADEGKGGGGGEEPSGCPLRRTADKSQGEAAR